ncbi:MAG TPA: AMP-binding protein, partial [Actinomycetota bacterium]
MNEIVWNPSDEYVERANVTRFMQAHGIGSYEDLLKRSTADIEWFWDAVVQDLGIEFYEPYDRVLDLSKGKPWATWFPGGRLNLAHNCVDRWAESTPERPAVVYEAESGDVRTVSYAELQAMANRLANGLRELGVVSGDRVGIFMPMAPEIVAATLACAKLGAIYLPIFSGFAPEAVATRLQDADAKVLITADGFSRRGSAVPMKETADQAVAMSPSVQHVVVWRGFGRRDVPWDERCDRWWHELAERQAATFENERLDSEHPLFIAYTSGT